MVRVAQEWLLLVACSQQVGYSLGREKRMPRVTVLGACVCCHELGFALTDYCRLLQGAALLCCLEQYFKLTIICDSLQK